MSTPLRKLTLPIALAALLAVGFLVACADESSGARPGLRIGLVVNAAYGGTNQLNGARELGVRWVREEFRWSEVEPRQGVRSWGRLDRTMLEAARRNIRVLPMLYHPPKWAARDARSLPRDPRAYARFAGRVVARYGSGGTFWQEHPGLDANLAPVHFEIWNEPWFRSFSRTGVNPRRYATLVRESGMEIQRRGLPGKLLLAAEDTYDADDGTTRSWLKDVLDAAPDLPRWFDAVSVHPYAYGSPDARTIQRRVQFRRLDDILAILRSRGLGGRKLWITEVGWSTCTRRPECTDERNQARYLRRAISLASETYRRHVEAIFVYHLNDLTGRQRSNRELFFGMVRLDGSRKPAWKVLRESATK